MSPLNCLEATSLQICQSPGQHARFECQQDCLTFPPGSVPPGPDMYTVPVFSDRNTGAVIDESLRNPISQSPSPARL
ncbi:uncharacterized protein BJ212DRAFT_1479626 [Suillus subaureus]|uniref:Uncharacterized protein n=1 Tax=Suillus subaureus TaxID=48587 RepID=A0A9P7EE99_9AGAM|nr:uncharacterized protein BJ212DRAFT_1479626 [Suillus subaureus]KAG1818625.1 hypothetical protein BJ212DRAFT_1479626 [Suillus subaureus]